MAMDALLDLLRKLSAKYTFAPIAIFQRTGDHAWPLVAKDEAELEAKLADGGHFLPLPKEPAALANVIEVAMVDYLIEHLPAALCQTVRGTERGYPDIEIEMNGKFYAVDIKVARRGVDSKGTPTSRTNSRITLYTGNTFFAHPKVHWPGTFRPFADYSGHIDLLGIYTLDLDSPTRVKDFEIIVAIPWQIASKERSSTTREYLGAVMEIDRLRAGKGEFATEADFYTYWRKYPFKVGRAINRHLQKVMG